MNAMKIINKVLLPSIQSKYYVFFRSPAPIYLGILIFFVLKICLLMPISPNDYWWYIQLGEDILRNHTIPTVDSYTYTQAEKPYIYNAWLSSIFFWLLRDTTSATLLHSILPLIFCGAIWKCCQIVGAKTRLTMILTTMTILVTLGHWSMRPQLFSFPLFGLTLLSVLQWRKGYTRYIWFLPIISLLWVNLHGAFPLLFLLAGAAFVGGEGERKTLTFALLIAFFTSLINPYGIKAWYYVYSVLIDTSTQQLGIEWLPPSINQSWNMKFFFAWLLAFPLITALSSQKLKFTDWLWFFGFGLMALSGLRYVVWFAAVFAPINAVLLAPLSNRTIDLRKTLGIPAFNAIIFSVFLILPVAFLPEIRDRWLPTSFPVYTSNTPIEAVEWIKKHPELPGNIWADLSMSVYLINALPERPVWIDTRTNLFPMKQWEEYIAIVNAFNNWENLFFRDGVELLLLDPKMQSQLINALTKSSNWISPYRDSHSIIFILSKKVHQ